MDSTCWIKVEPIEGGGEEKSQPVADADRIGVDLGINYKEYHQTEIISNIVKEEIQIQDEDAKDVSARWMILHEKSVREKTKDENGSGAAEKPGNSNVVCARQTTSSLPDSTNSLADVEEEADIDAEESNSRSSVKPSPLPSAYYPLHPTPTPFPPPTLQCSNTINSSLPFLTPTSGLFCISIKPTTPQTTLKSATPMHSSQRNSMKDMPAEKRHTDTLQMLNFSESDLYRGTIVRVSPEQRVLMIEFMEEHPALAFNKFCGTEGTAKRQQLWAELAQSLNTCGRGPAKPLDKWVKSWHDWKSDTKRKWLKAKKQADAGVPLPPIPDIERRLLKIVGKTNSSEAESPPLTEAEGTIPQLVGQTNSKETNGERDPTVSQLSCDSEGSESSSPSPSIPLVITEILSAFPDDCLETSSHLSPCLPSSTSQPSTSKESSKRKRRRRRKEDYDDETFLEERLAAAAETRAEAAKKMAEAAKVCAAATQQLADAFTEIGEAVSTAGDAIIKFLQRLKK